MDVTLLIFDSHPVQYRAPVWQRLAAIAPGATHVVYASDCSVRGHADTGFGHTIRWNEPLLTGYAYTLLHSERGKPLAGWGSLTSRGVGSMMDTYQPSAVLLTGLNYRYDLAAYGHALRRGIPIWLRCETQDEAMKRAGWKSVLRSIIYRVAYRAIDRFFYIGQLNRQHYRNHGVPENKLVAAHYATVDRFSDLDIRAKEELRIATRQSTGIADSAFVVGFSGKFISKKDPLILFRMLDSLPDKLRARIHFYFLGSGELELSLKQQAEAVLTQYGVKTFFAGFVNQSQLAAHYLAMDVLVLPSRRQGETWGLVVNEAMQAGCAVVVSDAVGCGADFSRWKRFRIFAQGDALALAAKVAEVAAFPRSFKWAREGLKHYSVDATAEALARHPATLPGHTEFHPVKSTY